MTTYNTGNPIGSKDPRDLYDNAENLDVAVNDDAATWVDRLGVQRSTLWQMLEYSKQFNDRGDWQTSTAYARKDYFTYGGVAYVTLTAHTSTSVAADLAAGKIGVMSGNSGAMDFLQAGTGAVARSVESKLRDVVSVKDFGAIGAGEDATSFFNAAIAFALANNKSLTIPSGNYVITAGLNQINGTINIFGDGRDSTKINFSPTSDNQILFDIYKSSGIDRVSINGLAVYGNGSKKLTYLKIDNITRGKFSELEFNGNANSVDDSIGMDLRGRDSCFFDGININNIGQPIVVNAGVSGGIDHFSFSNLYLIVNANPPKYPLFKINSGATTSNLSFSGYQAWVGGLGAFDHSGKSFINILFENLRYENAGVTVADANIVPTFKFNVANTGHVVKFHNCYVGSVKPTTTSLKVTFFYFRKCTYISFESVSIGASYSGQVGYWIDADNTCNNIIANNFNDVGSNYLEILGSEFDDFGSLSKLEINPQKARSQRKLVRKNDLQPYPSVQIGGSSIYNQFATLVNGADIIIPFFYGGTINQYIVAFTDGATPEIVYGGGHIMVNGPQNASTPNYGGTKISGTANLVVGIPNVGQVGIYKASGSTSIRCYNNTGSTIKINLFAIYSML